MIYYLHCVCLTEKGTRGNKYGFHYFLSEGSASWRTAAAACHLLDMNLARIDSRKERDWVHQTFGKSKAWIGLNDISREGDFKNEDGCRRRYVAWATDQPDNSGNEDCVQLSSKRGWNDNRCSQKFRFLCKKSDERVRTKCGADLFRKYRVYCDSRQVTFYLISLNTFV